MSTIIVKSKSRGNVIVSSNKIIFSPGVLKSGIAYNNSSLWSGQSTSVVVGDEGWRHAQGEYDRLPPETPEYIQELDTNSAEPFITLKHPNAFGNYNRFTAIDGTDAANSDYVIDHFTGLGWYKVVNTSNWNVALVTCTDSTAFGFNDWKLPNMGEMLSIVTFNDLSTYNYSPFNINLNPSSLIELWSSTHFLTNTLVVYTVRHDKIVGGQYKSQNDGKRGFIMVRRHY